MLSSPLSVAALSSFRHGTEASAIKPLPFQNRRHRALFPSLLLRRRIFLPTASSSIWDALTGGGGAARDASLAVRRGMLLFRQVRGVVDAPSLSCVLLPLLFGLIADSWSKLELGRGTSVDLWPSSIEPLSWTHGRRHVHIWQRGLSLYYLNRYCLKKAQSNSGWMLRKIQMTPKNLYGAFFVKLSFTGWRMLGVGRDSRPVMREAYSMFKDGGDPKKVWASIA
ncbi:hypothetical protein BHE74_00020738 [Ensete ventricosum]|nr:hypothetical protein GW17_00027034 [Ensete ventricosum]RWW71516.1 hypothetical protein BHE74_00020738 [Ensete ventricosum]RZS04575.1 hypothetical protein BHM03_00034929 [Ensete ventricosum]